jgi:hypothetical protein
MLNKSGFLKEGDTNTACDLLGSAAHFILQLRTQSLRLKSYDGNVVVHPLSDHGYKPMKVACLFCTPARLVSFGLSSWPNKIRPAESLPPNHHQML